jgi:hypothetical protein
MLITIGRYLSPIEAHIVRGRLEAEGIPAYVQHEHHIWANWTISLALGYVKLQVREEGVKAAVAVIENIQSGEYALLVEADTASTCCAKCGGTETERVNWSWKMALWGVIFFSLVIPYAIYRVRCAECNHSWTQQKLRGYPLWVSVFAVILISAGFIAIERTFYYVCKINFWSEVCT